MPQVYKLAHVEFAKIAGDSDGFDSFAQAIKEKASANAAANSSGDGRPDTYASSFSVEEVKAKKGYVKDRMVVTDDKNAMSKEFGHMSRGKKPVWVPGQFALIRAANG